MLTRCLVCLCGFNRPGRRFKFSTKRLNPLVDRYGLALLLTHNKVKSNKNAATNRDYNQSYDFFGSAELANFPRAIMILDRATDDAGEYYFTLRAPKRGTRLPWAEKEVYLRWAKECIFWEELSEKPASAAGGFSADPATRRQQKEAADRARLEDEVAAAVALLEPGQAIVPKVFRELIQDAGVSRGTSRIYDVVKAAVDRGLLTRRLPDRARGEGGKGISVVLERPKAARRGPKLIRKSDKLAGQVRTRNNLNLSCPLPLKGYGRIG